MTDKYAGLAGNQNAAKPEDQKRQGKTIHIYVPYRRLRALAKEISVDATLEQGRERAVKIAKDALGLLEGDDNVQG